MNKKFKKSLLLFTGGMTALALVNQYFEKSIRSEDDPVDVPQHTWYFRELTVRYSVMGEGTPILLIHDIGGHSSSVEWSETAPLLARHYKVYTLDLPGFGFSDKPVMTYTGYLFVDAITSFIRDIIKEKTDLIASGQTAGIALSVQKTAPELLRKIILVTPSSPVLRQPTTGIRRALLSVWQVPVFGTILYNLTYNRIRMEHILPARQYYRPQNVSRKLIHAFYQNAHRNEKGAVAVSVSRINHFFAVPTAEFAKEAEKLAIIYGKYNLEEFPILHKYKALNPHILFAPIEDSRKYPQLEMPDVFASQVEAIL
ncbi:MAG: alpha/beta fold hydrolase [Lachnospiraceae bacterium]|jgi:pimeloyl-ACP methyl ester carboxylesterase|nr:alpha/beta fold hydrolase [Lachnospiraceae bacterium]MCH4031671.1 alpha/beta fold hydrolase [Lachnospiraceae bacterium]MCH4071154.1 alpha/beta fold hydrolase [Lachnospiraceae bacterium]MCH4108225.1 alpha/beta fold hydrolase [Lachnospiraceae bacterium]MCI1303072.1 alpha/beta fold hydrolase [Lachnospiraceae bacterium]